MSWNAPISYRLGTVSLNKSRGIIVDFISSKLWIVNLDPANENIPYRCDVNITELITLERVMDEQGLGPNGALLYCMEYLEQHWEWLEEKLLLKQQQEKEDEKEEDADKGDMHDEIDSYYYLFDLPGQVELFTCHESLLNIMQSLERHHFRLTVVNLIDATACTDAGRYIAALLLTLKSMMQLGCSQVNLLSKVDLLESFDELPLPLEFFTQAQNLRHLFTIWEGDLNKGQNTDTTITRSRYHKLNEAICELIEDYSLISFLPLAIEDKDCMTLVVAEIDKANGLLFGGLTAGNDSIMQVAMSPAQRDHLINLVTERHLQRRNPAFLTDDESNSV